MHSNLPTISAYDSRQHELQYRSSGGLIAKKFVDKMRNARPTYGEMVQIRVDYEKQFTQEQIAEMEAAYQKSKLNFDI